MNGKKIIGIIAAVVIAGFAIWFWWRYYFVFASGVKAGTLNYIEQKGYVFKTWEGRLLQEGFRSGPNGGMGSIEFRFSVADDSLAHVLERQGGKLMELRYKEYQHPIAWRGASQFVVVEILNKDVAK